ncbi:hypothetical protein Y032_0008g168 [Ancylostoma ceylanicum]|uniref:Uncharacterized protein n=1 Tax=Ancylostoma ceylanicum TaxID=53326 RepID=A0A016VKE1_9BILA|nr:hypothetical protein Y032_0008g168 [Ancylostoma ceylanicum]
MVVCEIVFFVYWEFSDTDNFTPVEVIVSDTIELLFFDVLILPYLILNGNIHSQLKAVIKLHSAQTSRSNVRIDAQVSTGVMPL